MYVYALDEGLRSIRTKGGDVRASWRITAARAALACALSLAAVARAEDEAPPAAPPETTPDASQPPHWEFSVAPYLWGAGLNGTVEAGHQTADVNVTFSDIWDALDVGVLAAAEARYGKLSLTSNVIYMKLSTSAERPVGSLIPIAPPGSFQVRLTSKMTIIELRPTYEVLSLPLFGDERRIALDLGPGARIWWLDNHLDVKLSPGVPAGPFSQRFDASTDWVDFVGVARVRAQLTEKIGLVVSGDYGGFDIGSSSHRTWSALGFLSYRLGESWDLAAGYRTLSIDRGPVNLDMAGPLVGASYRF